MSGAPGQGPSVVTSQRLEAFSDGVMAVIITITAFEIKAPHGSNLAALRHEVPLLLVYVLSFSYIGIYWGNHHHLLRRSERISIVVYVVAVGSAFASPYAAYGLFAAVAVIWFVPDRRLAA